MLDQKPLSPRVHFSGGHVEQLGENPHLQCWAKSGVALRHWANTSGSKASANEHWGKVTTKAETNAISAWCWATINLIQSKERFSNPKNMLQHNGASIIPLDELVQYNGASTLPLNNMLR